MEDRIKKKDPPIEPVVTTSGETGTTTNSFFKQLQNTKMGRMLVFILLFTFIFKVINYILSFFNIGQELIYTYMVWFMIMFFLFVLLPMTRSYVKLPNIQTTKSNTNPTDGMMEVAKAEKRRLEAGAAGHRVETMTGNSLPNEENENNSLKGSGGSGGGAGTPIHNVLTRELMKQQTPGSRYQGPP